MPQTLNDALRDMRPLSDEADYRLLRLPANAITLAAGLVAETGQPFAALIVDEAEVSLLLRAEACQEFARRLRLAEISDVAYRLISLDVALDPGLVGFMARLSEELAAAGISILPYAAYSRDHIVVAAADQQRALSILREISTAAVT